MIENKAIRIIPWVAVIVLGLVTIFGPDEIANKTAVWSSAAFAVGAIYEYGIYWRKSKINHSSTA